MKLSAIILMTTEVCAHSGEITLSNVSAMLIVLFFFFLLIRGSPERIVPFLLGENGYMPYYMYRQKYQVGNNENVGWTKPNKACVYNIDIMEETADNLAVGANAVSKRVFTEKGLITRFASQKDLKTYIENIDTIIQKRREFFQ